MTDDLVPPDIWLFFLSVSAQSCGRCTEAARCAGLVNNADVPSVRERGDRADVTS